jgi:opacity protein-like surface antigen
MKKVLLSALAVFAFTFANAQEENKGNGGFASGDIFVSGGFGFGSAKFGEAKASQLTFSPAVGYFVADNIALGARLDIMSGKEEFGGAENKMSGFGAEVFGRYYWTPASQFSVFGEAAVGFGSTKNEFAGGGESKVSNFGINLGVGVSYFLNSNWAIEAGWAGLGYNSSKEDGADESLNTFGLGIDLSAINFGLVYKF